MSLMHDFDERFEFDQADRLRRALRVTGISVNDMADHLQVSRNTVTAWINGRNQPRRRDLTAFALRTGFPVQWLETGKAPHPEDGGPVEPPVGIEPTTYSLQVARERRARRRVALTPREAVAA